MADRSLPSRRHPLTGAPLTPIYRTRCGRDVYPIIGGALDLDDAPGANDAPSPLSYTHAETITRMEEIAETVQRLAAKPKRTEQDDDYLRDLNADFARLNEHRAKMEADEAAARMENTVSKATSGRTTLRERNGDSSGLRIESGSGVYQNYDRDPIYEPDSIADHRFRNPWALGEMRTYGRNPGEVARELHSRALSAVEKMQGTNDQVRAAATTILERWDDQDANLSRLCLVTSSPEYLRAWSKMAADPMHADLSEAERMALNESKTAQRAMSLADPSGGYLVPFQLDPTIILTSDGSFNEIRQIARTVVATGDVWNGVSAGAVAWSFDAEAAEVSDDSPTFGAPAITVRTARGFVPISLEARLDANNVTAEVARLLVQGKDDLEAQVFITGDPVLNQPIGIVTALTGVAPSTVGSATTDTFAFNDLYRVQGALSGRYRRRASWLGNNLFWNSVRQTAPEGVWKDPETDRPGGLLGRPVYEAEAMDGTVTPAVDNLVTIFGDFSNYVIADRVGMTVDFIPHLFGANRRPTGQSGWFAYYRVGADSVNDAAFRVLNIT